jgi:hypothetical protein
MTAIRKRVLQRLADMSERYPEWRLGQMVANAAAWARQPTEPNDSGIWEVEDEEVLAALERHLEQGAEIISQAKPD